MTPRTGRPKVDNPKHINLTIRIDSEIKTMLDEYCAKNNITKGEVVRLGLKKILGEKK